MKPGHCAEPDADDKKKAPPMGKKGKGKKGASMPMSGGGRPFGGGRY